MEAIFWICANIMKETSSILGITYAQLNVLFFVILHPAVMVFVWFKYRRYKKLWKHQITTTQTE